MHLDEADSELLKKWIIKKLEDISDADSDVLADYVLALAKTEDPESVAKRNCIENLKDFLVDNAEPFVHELFQAISSKSYDPTRPPPKPSAPVYQPPKRASAELPRLPNESRKRSYHDWDREELPGMNGHMQSHEGLRPLKQPRRGGREYEQRGGGQPNALPMYGLPPHHLTHLPQLPTPPPGMPPIDPNNPMAAFFAMQQALGMLHGMPSGSSPPNGRPFAPPRSGQRCWDYDTKGYCAAGASCPYEHGNETLVLPGLNQEYDPANATLLNITPSRIGQVSLQRNERASEGSRGRGRGSGNRRGGGKRSDFSQLGPSRDISNTSIVVEQIPDDKCDEDTVRAFFSEFGDIEDVDLQTDMKLAIIKYSTYNAARAAYQSPKVVFDNRFVKVYWHKSEDSTKDSGEQGKPTARRDRSHDAKMMEDDQIDLAEVARQQEIAQRKHDEAKKQREEATKQRQDVDAKLKQMEAERQKVADLLAKKTGKTTAPAVEPANTNGTEETEQTKALKAQLAKLEAEAKSLGIDPDAPTNPLNTYPSFQPRGGYRGRARGRGYQPGYRGGWAGGGARGGAVMRLDNRPKTVAVTFSDGSYSNHDEALRQFLLFNSLDSAAMTKHPDRDDIALITFNQRYEGENFMAAAGNSELLHIGKVELSWYKADDKPAEINGGGKSEARVVIAETSDQLSSGAREAYDHAEDEDLDRWS